MPKQLRSPVNLCLLDDDAVTPSLVQLQVELACGWIGLKRKGGRQIQFHVLELEA